MAQMSIGDRKMRDTKVDPKEQIIVDRIFAAVMEQRLAPRTKLSEAVLCKSFNVGRMRVRRALLLLDSQGIVELHANRGAFVACPGAAEAREVFEARKIIETGIVRELADGADAAALAPMRAHIAREEAVRRGGDRMELIRISGEFHVELARCHGNPVLIRNMRELVTRTSLIVAMFGIGRHAACPGGEHGDIIAAIAAGDPAAGTVHIRKHLAHIQDGLDLDQTRAAETDLARVLQGA